MERILDWNHYLETAAQTVAEGIVMVKNENHALPLNLSEEIAVFGRIQLHYYKSGTGSGGMVNVSKVTGILDGLLESGVKINQELLDVYKKWDAENPFDLGSGWANEPWAQEEMPLSDKLVKNIASQCKTAIVIIGRTAGEEQDYKEVPGSYRLAEKEWDMLKKARAYFEKVIVLLNVPAIIDMNFLDECQPDACLYVWQGGMTGGTGTAAVLTGKVSPCGKLTDTIAYEINDYPSNANFGSKQRNFYCEDIYVGYRYFETFAKDRVRFPFGFGLSYTTFDIQATTSQKTSDKLPLITITVNVKNTGDMAGKEVVQLYYSAPQGKLGKPARQLCAFEKTSVLEPGCEEQLSLSVPFSMLSSYDDSGKSGHKSCYVLEEGEYCFYVGSNIRSAKAVYSVTLDDLIVTESLSQAMAPVLPFERMVPECTGDKLTVGYEKAPQLEVDEDARHMEHIPIELPFTDDRGIKLGDVLQGRHTMDEFVAQFNDYDLSCIIRGEGMGSPKVTAGTASAFGGVSDRLTGFGVPCGCCADGPSGMRLDCGTKAFSLPNGTMIASTFNKNLITELFTCTGMEMIANKVDCLLGPGMNLHRHPLNGRNFEYFSEDPYLTGMIASAELKGLQSVGVTGTLKHFCGNNQETGRHVVDNVISERALREIYLRGFEIAVKQGNANSIMTTYGPINGLWTAGNHDLNTTILRNEWHYTGFVMTDWWPFINERDVKENKTNFAAMAKAQNDIYMVCSDGSKNPDNTLESLENGSLTRAELQRNAKNICNFLMGTHAMKRMMDDEDVTTILNRPVEDEPNDEPVVFHEMDDEITLNLEDVVTERGRNFCFGLTVNKPSQYHMTLTASTTQGELAQVPLTVFCMGTSYGTFTFNGTNGEPVSIEKDIPMFSHFITFRLYFAQSGLKLHSVRFEKTDKELKWGDV